MNRTQLLLALASLAAAPDVAVARKAATSSSVVPFTMVSSGDNPRPVVVVRFNGHPMPMMVHSNAGFFAQLKHAQAAAFGITLQGEHTSYGIDRPGHVSQLGLDHGTAASLAVGNTVDRNVPVSVFEVPQARLGMLGIGWISRNRLILDYGRRQAIVSPTAAQVATTAARARRAGYVALPLSYDTKERRYTVQATINGITRTMTIGSASEFTIDTGLANPARLALGRDVGSGNGPTGTHVAEHALAAPVRVTVGSWTSPPIPTGRIVDMYGYSDEPRPTDSAAALGGSLGGSFLLTTRAVIDFGSQRLYVPRG